jgi:translation initiation factor 1
MGTKKLTNFVSETNIMAKDWKDRLGVVYSTNSDFQYEKESDQEEETLDPQEQDLRVSIDRKGRKGKTVTLITRFIGTKEDLEILAKKLKSKCGTGGSAKDGEIIIQGDFCETIIGILKKDNYGVKRSGA